MEPPGPDVPGPVASEPDEPAPVGPVRLTAATTAAAIALAGAGHVGVLAALLAVAAARPTTSAALALAAGATVVRWGSGSLAALGGAQAVLGPAGLVGPTAAAASSWLAAAAVLLCTPGPLRLKPTSGIVVGAIATGATAATLAVGPSAADEPVLRVAGVLVAVLVALATTFVPWRRAMSAAAFAAGLAAAVTAVVA